MVHYAILVNGSQAYYTVALEKNCMVKSCFVCLAISTLPPGTSAARGQRGRSHSLLSVHRGEGA